MKGKLHLSAHACTRPLSAGAIFGKHKHFYVPDVLSFEKLNRLKFHLFLRVWKPNLMIKMLPIRKSKYIEQKKKWFGVKGTVSYLKTSYWADKRKSICWCNIYHSNQKCCSDQRKNIYQWGAGLRCCLSLKAGTVKYWILNTILIHYSLLTIALPWYNSSRNENINVRTKRITSERINFFLEKEREDFAYYAFMKTQQFQRYDETTKKKSLYFELSLLFYAIKIYQHLVKNKEFFLKDTCFWLTMVDTR